MSTLALAVLPNTVLAFKPPDVMIPCSKSARFFSRFLRKYSHPPPNKASKPPNGASKLIFKPSMMLAIKPGSSTGAISAGVIAGLGLLATGAAASTLTESSGFTCSAGLFFSSGFTASTGVAGAITDGLAASAAAWF